MTILLRTVALAAALTLAALTTGHATTIPTGTCEIFCANFDTGSYSTQYWESTERECCSGTLNPCPPGTMPTSYAFLPYGGFAELCQLN